MSRVASERASDRRRRCAWVGPEAIDRDYHDREWGVPVHDDRRFFEFLVLEGAQAGLSWATILRKREAYRKAFSRFDPRLVARYDGARIERLLANSGIVRNRLKLESTVANARAFLALQREFGSFDSWVWSLVGNRPRRNRWKSMQQVPATTADSEALCRELRQRGFRFVGPTICYAFMQATGLVNDHVVGCFRYRELGAGR